MEKRREHRVATNLLMRVWGMGADGKPFLQKAEAHNISSQGAKLSGIEHQLTPGDVIGVQLGDKKARFRVVWVIDAGYVHQIQAGIRLVDSCTAARISRPASRTSPPESALPQRIPKLFMRPVLVEAPRPTFSYCSFGEEAEA